MKMEGLHRYLCCSRYSSLSPVYPLRSLFLVFTIFICCLPPSCRACEEPWECGNLTFRYPFSRMNSGCGDPALQVDCDPALPMPLINISAHQYYILDISENWKTDNWYEPDKWHEDHTITIIDKDQWSQGCNPSFINHTSEIWSSLQFSIAQDYRNLTLWEDCPLHTIQENLVYPLPCNRSWYLNSTEELSFGRMCKSQVTLPVPAESLEKSPPDLPSLVLRINWSPTQECERCLSQQGICEYETNSMQFHCNCGVSPNPDCPSDNSKTNPANSKTNPARSIILGGIIGSAALLLMGVLLLFLNRRRFSLTSSQEPDLSGVEKFLRDYVHQMPSRYSYSQLTKITNNFAHKIGEGGFGVVYKGKLPTGELVAVKMLDQSRRCENQFMNEVATLGRVHHVHLVRLMGYFYEEYRNALVYEYMANGSLDEFIFAGRQKEEILNWAQLYSIALGAARGIAYLHQDCNNRIIHFDIKPHNILLDVDLTPKIADFGLAKLCGRGDDHISMTAARGTPGYAAPEVWNRNLGSVTEKSDVYSFGMVLLEMVGGRKNVDVQVSRSSQLYFPEWAFKMMEKGELERGLRGSGRAEIECEEMEKAAKLAKVGLWCIHYNSRDRPSMSRVVQMMEGNGDDVSNPPLPFNSSHKAAPSTHTSEESSV